MMKDYFVDNPVYGPDLFRHRYRKRHFLLVSILEFVCDFDSYFAQKYDTCGLQGLSPHQKITSILRMLCSSLCAGGTNVY